MNFEHERWRPLFVREPVERRRWSLFARGVRAYLIQVSEDDGTLLKRCADPLELATTLSTHPEEMELAQEAIGVLLRDGFLRWKGEPGQPGWLGVERLYTGRAGKTPAAAAASETPDQRKSRKARERKARFNERQRSAGGAPNVPASVPEGVLGSVPASVPEGVLGSVPRRSSPQSPLLEKQPNKQKNRLEQRQDTRAESVPDSVPAMRSGPVEPHAEHERFAAEHHLPLVDILRELNADGRVQAMALEDAHKELSRRLASAAAAAERAERDARADRPPELERARDAAAQ